MHCTARKGKRHREVPFLFSMQLLVVRIFKLCVVARRLKSVFTRKEQSKSVALRSARCRVNYPINMENFINKTTLAEALGVSNRTLEIWCAHRNFPKARRLPGSRLAFFCIAEVDTWLEATLEAEIQE